MWCKFNSKINKMEDYTKEIGFWQRLESFVKDVQIGCAIDEEEKDMILHNCKLKILDLQNASNSASGVIEIDTKIQLLPRKWWQIYKRGWQTHRDFFGRRYFVRYNWVK